MRTRKADEIGTSGKQDRVHMVRLVDIADSHRRHACLVADAVRKRRLEHAAVNRTRIDRSLSGRNIADIDARRLQHPRNLAPRPAA